MIETMGQMYALALALVVAAIYLAVIRFLDLNEKEPLWALALFFFLGAQVAGLLYLLVPSRLLELSLWPAVLIPGLGQFVAVAVGMAILGAIARLRGWSEVNGLMDGIVYGFAAGLGYATAAIFMKQVLHPPTLISGVESGAFTTIWTSALAGLGDGLFGSLIGAGFGATARARGGNAILYPLLGLAASISLHLFHRWLAFGNALGGSEGLTRAWAALLIPVVLVLVVALYALARERRAIREQLAGEESGAVVTSEEQKVLAGVGARQSLYWNALMKGRWEEWAGLKSLHDRQVQLALAKQSAKSLTDEAQRAAAESEITKLRAAILEVKQALSATTQTAQGVPSP